MKKIFAILISIVIVGLTSSQTLQKTKEISKDESKSVVKDVSKNGNKINLKEVENGKSKSPISKDTIDKNKISFINSEIVSDTLFFETGKLKSYKKNVHASYYHDKFNGKKTSSGVRFNNNKYTAAHKKLPFGTKVKVTNIASGKSVIVEITDRGPFVKSREIDLSKRAFMEIAKNKGIGVMMVNIEVIE